MRFSTAAVTSTLIAATASLQYATAFSPSIHFQQHHQRSKIQERKGKRQRSSSLFVLNEKDRLSDILSADSISPIQDEPSAIHIEEGSGDIISSIDVVRKSTKSYLSNYKNQSGASIVYSKLVENNVSVVNGYSGGAVLPLLDQFHQDHPRHKGLPSPPIRWITNSNENSAGHIAEGYAKSAPNLADGKQPAGVVVATSGPGVTNLITPLQDAICDGVPMVVLCGQAATTAPQDAFQAAPAVDLTRPCTKWSYQIKNTAELPFVMDYAFFIARNGRPGPVFVDLPKDLQNQILDEKLIEEFADKMPVKKSLIEEFADKMPVNVGESKSSKNAKSKKVDNYDGIARLFPKQVGVNGVSNSVAQYALHIGLPEKGILFEVNSDYKGIKPVHGIDLDSQEELYHLDHNPSDTVYHLFDDTDDEVKDELNPTSKTVKKIYSLLKKAKKPLIIAGQGCNECPEELKKFAEALQIPVATTLHGLGCFDERNKLALNMVGMHGHPTPNYMTQESDLIVCIGSRFDDRITGRLGDFIPEAKKAAKEYRGGVIHVDIRVTEKAKQVKPTYFVHSTGKKFLNTMNQVIEDARSKDPAEANTITQEWLSRKKSLERDFPVKVPFFPTENVIRNEGGQTTQLARTRMSAQSVVTEMNRQILAAGKMDDCVFSTGVGIHQMVSAQLITWTQPKQMVSSGSLGTMGVALGFIIGCKLANGHKICIAVDGDGSFNMTFTELKTVAEQKIPVKIMILDNESQMMVEYWQRLFHDARYLAVTNTVNPNYSKLADAFGIKNLYVDCAENLEDVMRQFLFDDPDEPVLLHARIERTPCLPLVAPGAPLQDMILEDKETEGGFDASAAPS